MTCKPTYECPYCSKRLPNYYSACCGKVGEAIRNDPENEADAEYDRMKEAEDENR
jgi:hypothetical protein